MIQTSVIPVATATEQQILAQITEKLCRQYCILGEAQPTATVSFTAGAPTVADGVAIFPMTALVTVISPTEEPCGCSHSQVFRENFTIAFTATATNTLTIGEGTTTIVTPAYSRCCKACGVHVVKTFTATIA